MRHFFMSSSNNRVPSSPLARRIKIATAGFLTAAALFASAPGAFAGAAEANALQLVLGKPLSLATSSELLAAYNTVILDPKFNTSAKRAVVAGEALKGAGPNAIDAGAVFGAAFTGGAPADDVLAADRVAFLAAAAKTAGTGKGLNVTQILDVSAAFFTNDSAGSANARASAALAGSNVAKGAILGGHASELADDAAKTAFAIASIADSKLKAAVQDISRYVGAEVTDAFADDFAVAVAIANPTATLKIAPGVAAGKPTFAGAITSALLTNATVGATARAGAVTLVKSVAAVADIEEIAKIAAAVSTSIGANVATKPIKLSQAASITTTLAKAILAKPSSSVGANRIANKQDELGELAASIIRGLTTNADFTAKKASVSATTIVNIIKAAANAGVIKDKINPATGVAFTAAELAVIRLNTARDIVASAALTIREGTWGNGSDGLPIEDAILNLLTKQDSKGVYTTIASIAGIGKINATDSNGTAPGGIPLAVQNVLDAINGVNTTRFENGLFTNVSDPETDFRPL